MKNRLSVLVILTFLLLGCERTSHTSIHEEYIMQAFDSIATYSLHHDSFNFDSLESEVLSIITDSTSREDIYQKLEQALLTIDKHSYCWRKEKWTKLRDGTDPEILENLYPFKGKMLNEEYAYVGMEGFSGGDSVSVNLYCDSLHKVLLELNSEKPLGWILDLRYNDGGWSPAMFAGIGPLLGYGVKAHSISPTVPNEEHYYAKSETDYLEAVDSLWTIDEQVPVAVLIGESTGSAGELVALAFRGNKNAQLLGRPSFGISTDLTPVFMPDSFQMIITSGIMTDRFESGDGGKIIPQVRSETATETFELAYEWIDSWYGQSQND